ncbi:MAG: PGPGW domain-containing protein [Armatimonadota bacterium]|nr:PGPGW domain-containing protein [Armatimonadota bacterium]
MIDKLKKNWKQFKNDEPGTRCQNAYHRRQQESQGRLTGTKLFNIIGGLVVVLAGIFFVPAPGPGSAIIVLGLGLLGSEFLPVARFVDASEIKARAAARETKEFWAKSSLGTKAVISLMLLTCLAAMGYGAYSLFFDSGSKG